MTVDDQDANMERFTSCGFLYNPRNKTVLLHLRDGKTSFHPNQWAFFGGVNEGRETTEECYRREMEEEIGFAPSPENIHFLRRDFNPEARVYFYVFFSIHEGPIESFALREGADFAWVPLDAALDLNLVDYARKDLEFFRETVVKQEPRKADPSPLDS